jgi:uncharacterized protein (DUF1330 family)
MKFSLLLWAFGLLMKKAAKSNEDFKKQLVGKDVVIQIQTGDTKKGRHFIIKDGKVKSKRGLQEEPSLGLVFKDAETALSVMTSKDKNAFMKAVQEKDLAIKGDFSLLMWLMGLVKYMKPKKKKK